MIKHLTIFRVIYLLVLVFALIHFILGLFGLAFTPILWNFWFFALIIWFMIFFILSTVPDSSMPINLDYYVIREKNEIRIIRGFLLHEIHEYHDLVNPLIMKSKVKYVEKN